MRCPRCGGKMKPKPAKLPGGLSEYKCQSCKRKFTVDEKRGGLKQVG